MGIDEILKEKREEILCIAEKHGVGKVKVFGSVARGDAGTDSDVDFLIEVTGQRTSWFPGGLVADLEELLGRRVSVIEPDVIRESLRENILKEAVTL